MRKKQIQILSRFALSFFFILFFSFISSNSFAENSSEPSSEKLSSISQNCPLIKQNLKKLKNTDQNARILLGRIYQDTLSTYIIPLNINLVKISQSNSYLMSLQSNFTLHKESFNRDFISYSQEFETLINIDCTENPTSFYQQLLKTREKREKLAESVSTINDLISRYLNFVPSLKGENHGQ